MTRLRWPALWWTLGALGLATVSVASLLPLPADLPSPPGDDLTLHLVAWGGLSAWFGQLARGPWRTAALLLVYSLVIELLQGQTAYRHAELRDALANALGVVLGAWWASRVGARCLVYLEGRVSRWMARTRS